MGDGPVSLEKARQARGAEVDFEARAEGFMVRTGAKLAAIRFRVTGLITPGTARKLARVLERAARAADANRRKAARKRRG